jgi:cyclohexyl-isocyanide hydratase
MSTMQIGFVLFPNLTQLDLTGPLQVLHRLPDAKVHVVSNSLNPVPSDCGLSLVPNATFADVPHLDLLCIPGGFGVSQAIADRELMNFVRRVGTEARYISSVCTGAFVLGAAGLLRGKRATTHWAYHHLLEKVGAIPTEGRVVSDGNLTTGGGVTAGIDFAFSLVEQICGPEVADRIQVVLEYRPQARAFPGSGSDALQTTEQFLSSRLKEFSQELDQAVAQES